MRDSGPSSSAQVFSAHIATVYVLKFEHFPLSVLKNNVGYQGWKSQTGKTLIRLLLQKQSDLGLRCLSRPFWQASSVQKI